MPKSLTSKVMHGHFILGLENGTFIVVNGLGVDVAGVQFPQEGTAIQKAKALYQLASAERLRSEAVATEQRISEQDTSNQEEQ